MKRIAAALFLLTVPLAAQQHKQFNLVAATVPGRIEVPPEGNGNPRGSISTTVATALPSRSKTPQRT